MSAILKALRKIESQSGGQDSVRSLSKKLDTKRAMNQRVRRVWLLHRAGTFLGLLFVLAAVAAIGLKYKSLVPKGSAPAPAVSEVPKDEASGLLPPHSDAVEQEKTRQADGKKRVPEPGGGDKREVSGLSLSKTADASPEKNASQRTPQQNVAPPSSRAERAAEEPSEPVLELQAVVWSDDAASCFAVINGAIVRTGGQVEGILVTDIGKNSVSLKHRDRRWTLKMIGAD